jgi:uncharacterized protein (TIGR02996 family)
MTDDRAFVNTLLARPTDSTARLVYADWLDERGDVRGEYLRLSVEMSRHASKSRRHAVLSERLAALRPGIDPEWLASVSRLSRLEVEPWDRMARLLVDGDRVAARFAEPFPWEWGGGGWLDDRSGSVLDGMSPGRSGRQRLSESVWALAHGWRDTVTWSAIGRANQPAERPPVPTFVFRRDEYDRTLEAARRVVRRPEPGRRH